MNIGQQKVGSKSLNHFANLQTMCKTIIRIWDRFYHNCFRDCHHQNTKGPELFHLACLLHEASRLPYVKGRLITVGQNHLARMHANPIVKHTINSARTNIVPNTNFHS